MLCPFIIRFINRHVLDERRLLAYMDSPFVMKLYGTYQTPHTLVMVTEPLSCGDLWSIIYETPPFSENNGLPFELAAFYATCLVWGLSHIHEKGVVYRDLKPENIMLDDKGYIRIIDFGFSKRVPYTKKDSSGVVKVLAKTYTLCGTPGMGHCILLLLCHIPSTIHPDVALLCHILSTIYPNFVMSYTIYHLSCYCYVIISCLVMSGHALSFLVLYLMLGEESL